MTRPSLRRTWFVAGALVLAFAASACSPESSAPPSATRSPSASPSASPTGSPAPTSDRGAADLAAATAPGKFATTRATYVLPDLRIQGLQAPVEVEGHVVAPVGATGPLPLVIFLHGYTGSCYRGADSSADWPCAPGFRPIPSWRGFDYLQQRLASQGYLTVSLSANGVNALGARSGTDGGARARALLVQRHLKAWAGPNRPGAGAWPSVDVEHVLLVGHSRGAEGVDHAVATRPAGARWGVAGEVLIGPTEFDRPATSTTSVVALTGSCDGDVGPGPGQRYVDRPAASPQLIRSAVIIDGANHNYFNTEWTPGSSTAGGAYDDAALEDGSFDPLCAPDATTRLQPGQQRELGLRMLGIAAAALLRHVRPTADVLDGQVPVPGTGSEVVRISALGRGRTTLVPGPGLAAAGEGAVKVRRCRGVSETEDRKACGFATGEGQSVHWPDEYRGTPAPDAIDVSWSAAGGGVLLRPSEPLDASAGLEARVAVAPEGSPLELDVVLTDSAGATATVATAPLAALRGGTLLPSRRWGQRLYVDPQRAEGVDLSAITSIALVPRSGPGHLWIVDLSVLAVS